MNVDAAACYTMFRLINVIHNFLRDTFLFLDILFRALSDVRLVVLLSSITILSLLCNIRCLYQSSCLQRGVVHPLFLGPSSGGIKTAMQSPIVVLLL